MFIAILTFNDETPKTRKSSAPGLVRSQSVDGFRAAEFDAYEFIVRCPLTVTMAHGMVRCLSFAFRSLPVHVFATLILSLSIALASAAVAAQTPDSSSAPASAYRTLKVVPVGTPRWWHDAVVYEIWPRSFQDRDGDGNGDFAGLIDRLDYLKDLGVDAIWLTPVFEAPSYHGYDFEDFYAIERDYGSKTDFTRFVTAAHERGIKVIVDMVLNHVSDQHPWFQASARRVEGFEDAFIWRDKRPELWGQPWLDTPDPAAVWHWSRTRRSYYYGAFGASQPDLNLRNPNVVGELDHAAAFWLKAGVDGFRLDAVRYAIEDGALPGQADTQATIDYWTAFAKKARAIDPDVLLVGEAWAALDIGGRYHNDGKGLDAAFDFDFGGIVIEILNPQGKRRADFGTVSRSDISGRRESLWANLQQRAAAAPLGYFSPFLTNHDQDRIMHALGGDVAKAKIAASLLLTSPGTVYLYYGEEIGLSQYAIGDDRYRRAPMQWDDSEYAGFNANRRNWIDLPAPRGYRGDQGRWWAKYWKAQRGKGVSVAAQQSEPGSLLQHYRRLVAVRDANPELRQPQELRYHPVDAADVWVLQSLAEDQVAWVVIHLDPTRPASFAVPAELQGTRLDQLSGQSRTIGATLTLQPGETLVF